jgi:hypothetical protein
MRRSYAPNRRGYVAPANPAARKSSGLSPQGLLVTLELGVTEAYKRLF